MRLILLVAATMLIAVPASAQERGERGEERQQPAALTRVFECRAVQAAEERLACYDRQVAALASAEASQEVVVYDREQLKRTRRSLFGIALPNLNVFGGSDKDEESRQIEGTIRSVGKNAAGRYVFILDDGARWVQTDSRELSEDPRAGQPIRIRQAAMGSYLANVNKQTAIRVRRELPER